MHWRAGRYIRSKRVLRKTGTVYHRCVPIIFKYVTTSTITLRQRVLESLEIKKDKLDGFEKFIPIAPVFAATLLGP